MLALYQALWVMVTEVGCQCLSLDRVGMYSQVWRYTAKPRDTDPRRVLHSQCADAVKAVGGTGFGPLQWSASSRHTPSRSSTMANCFMYGVSGIFIVYLSKCCSLHQSTTIRRQHDLRTHHALIDSFIEPDPLVTTPYHSTCSL